MAQFCIDADGNMSGKTCNAKYWMFETFNEIMKEMVDAGRITKVMPNKTWFLCLLQDF